MAGGSDLRSTDDIPDGWRLTHLLMSCRCLVHLGPGVEEAPEVEETPGVEGAPAPFYLFFPQQELRGSQGSSWGRGSSSSLLFIFPAAGAAGSPGVTLILTK